MTSEFEEFSNEMLKQISAGSRKGYTVEGLPEFALNDLIAGAGAQNHHSVGEAIFKLQRYLAMGRVEDLFKAGAWCFLAYRWHRLNRSAPQQHPRDEPTLLSV